MIETGSNETYIQLSAVLANSDKDQPITVRGDNTVVKRDGVLTLIRPDDEEYGAYAGENCYTSAAKCTKTPGTCDFQLFVVWSGTDSRGQVLQSTNLRISRFQKGSIESIMNEL